MCDMTHLHVWHDMYECVWQDWCACVMIESYDTREWVNEYVCAKIDHTCEWVMSKKEYACESI